ncbi:MAG: hypothetical protein AAGB04_07575 [Pseudomonadota bacterium]
MPKRFMEDPAATAALREVVVLYTMTDCDDDQNELPLSGADVVEELGMWLERNRKLLRKLGIIEEEDSFGNQS